MSERRMAYLQRYEKGQRMGMYGFVKAGSHSSGWKGTLQISELPVEGPVQLAAVVKRNGQTVTVRAMEEIKGSAKRLQHHFLWEPQNDSVIGIACIWGKQSWDIALWEACPMETMALSYLTNSETTAEQESREESVEEPKLAEEPKHVKEPEPVKKEEPVREPVPLEEPESPKEPEPIEEPFQDPKKEPIVANKGTEWIREQLPRMYPFDDDEFTWCVRMETSHLAWLSERYAKLAINSFLLEGYYSYRHLVFAKKEHNNSHTATYMLGVPGIYHKRDSFLAGMFGFRSFKPVKSKGVTNRMGQFGYWCMPINIP